MINFIQAAISSAIQSVSRLLGFGNQTSLNPATTTNFYSSGAGNLVSASSFPAIFCTKPLFQSAWQFEIKLLSTFNNPGLGFTGFEFGFSQEMVNLSQASRTPLFSLSYNSSDFSWSSTYVSSTSVNTGTVTWDDNFGSVQPNDVIGMAFDPVDRTYHFYLVRGNQVFNGVVPGLSTIPGQWTPAPFFRLPTGNFIYTLSYETNYTSMANKLAGFGSAIEQENPDLPVFIYLTGADSTYQCVGGVDYLIIDGTTNGCSIYIPGDNTGRLWTDLQKIKIRGNPSADTMIISPFSQISLMDGGGNIDNMSFTANQTVEITASTDTGYWYQTQ